MPMLFLLLFGMALNALTLDGARQGIDFLLKPDFSKITGTTVLEALGQSFFSMSLWEHWISSSAARCSWNLRNYRKNLASRLSTSHMTRKKRSICQTVSQS